jgi:RNA polymerase sigma-70 factor (ECF subfamily)
LPQWSAVAPTGAESTFTSPVLRPNGGEPAASEKHEPSAAQSGPERFEQAYRECATELRRVLTRYTGDAELAEDAVAEAFVQALARGDAIRSPVRWIWTSAFRIAAGELKQRRLVPLDGVDVESVPGAADADAPLESEALELTTVMTALARLPLKQRGALLLHDYAGLGAREAAVLLRSTPGAVRVHLFRGRKRAREMLADEVGADVTARASAPVSPPARSRRPLTRRPVSRPGWLERAVDDEDRASAV